jgi:tetratricopeptide (TPR) repeat protein
METVGNQVIATVRGSEDYLVVLTLPEASSGAPLRGECNCPYGQEGFFCKHCVAVGLAILRDSRAVPRQRGASKGAGKSDSAGATGTASEPSDLSAWLKSLNRDDLVSLVCDQAVEDADWRRRLALRAATAASDVPAVTERALGLLSGDEEFGQYRFAGQYGYLEGPESWYYARRVRQVTDAVRQLSAAGRPGDAMLIAERALAAITGSSRHASDRAGVIAAAAADLTAAHHEACRATATDPVRLADFLAARMIDPDNAEPVDPADYADLLGAEGVARLRERLSRAWAANPAGWPERLAMESILTLTGDVDGLVEVLAANLDGRGHGYLRIAEELEQAGRADEALTWAERGLRESREPDQPLADYLAGRYLSAGRVLDALTVRRERFMAAPSVPGYELLRDTAELAGTWNDVRRWALDLVREQAARRPRTAGAPGWTAWTPACVLVDVLIADGDIDAAWTAAEGLASDDQWLRLANLVIESRPADALAVYRRLITTLTRETGDAIYERVAQLLTAARTCHRRLGTEAAFAVYLRALREDQKRKRKLIRILDAHGLR